MRKIILLSFITLDGVMQAPGGPDEDTSGGFHYGGWAAPHSDETSGQLINQQMSGEYDLLLGRKTYDIFASYWPFKNGPIADPFNRAIKYVVSHTQIELPWEKSVLITGDVVSHIKALKEQDGPMLQVHGSGNMVQTLLENDLVDELWLKIFPVTLGSGKKLFAEGTQPAGFELIHTQTTPGGIIFANYKRAGAVEIGSF